MRETNIKNRRWAIWGPSSASLWIAMALLLAVPAARGQLDPEQSGVDEGNYNIKQSIEFGGRFVSVSGDSQAYDTFINLQQGRGCWVSQPRFVRWTITPRCSTV
jgi:hypothetical protein